MTRYEAALRAATIWDKAVTLSPNGITHAWWVEVAGDPDRLHYLDEHGHTRCHPDCAKLEKDLQQRFPVLGSQQ